MTTIAERSWFDKLTMSACSEPIGSPLILSLSNDEQSAQPARDRPVRRVTL
jgi:hypothetical protein